MGEQKHLDTIVDEFHAKICSDRPWSQAPRPEADLSWHTPTCTAEDWRHTDVKLQLGQGIAYVFLNRPEQNNSMNDTVIAALMDAVIALQIRKDIRVVVFSA